jgi:hypothetical protein
MTLGTIPTRMAMIVRGFFMASSRVTGVVQNRVDGHLGPISIGNGTRSAYPHQPLLKCG